MLNIRPLCNLGFYMDRESAGRSTLYVAEIAILEAPKV